MGRPSARELIMDAYEDILIGSGLAAVTLDAVAAGARVSKGGLLYHFGSKEALLDGLLDRLLHRTREDVEHARTAPEGAIRYFLTSSATDADLTKPAHRTAIAALRLLGSEPKVTAAMTESFRLWTDLVAEHVDDPVTAELVGLLGDGLYVRATITGVTQQPALDHLAELLHRLGIEPG